MCLHHPVIANLSQYNWDGDRIIFDSIVPSSRSPIGRTEGGEYDIDVREFLVSENNAVIKRTLQKDLPKFMRHIQAKPSQFLKRSKGAFDFRANIIAAFVSENIRYESKDGRDPWQFPDETLFLKSGDCEDIAFLLASLLLASGISAYNVRVVLGRVRVHAAKKTDHDHMWVMYKSESGRWLLLEPLHLNAEQPEAHSQPLSDATPEADCTIEYIPQFMFNTDHLWLVGDGHVDADFKKIIKKEWHKLSPKFIGAVHQTIINSALTPNIAPQYVIDALNRHFSRILGISEVVDDIDNFVTHGYDPLDHFDNGYVDEGWQRVTQRLNTFKKNNGDLDSFAYAAHAIADFYAHTSYVHFAEIVHDKAALYDPGRPTMQVTPRYTKDSTFNLETGPFTLNKTVFNGNKLDAATTWQGKLISGRYAQKGDSKDWKEALTFMPRPLTKAQGFANRGALPHHNEMAVDSEKPDANHTLYTNPTDYQNQFRWRKAAAIAHIRAAFRGCWQKR